MHLACGTSAEASTKYVNIHCYHTPALPVTVLSSGQSVTHHSSKYETQTIIYANHCTKLGYARIDGMVDVPDIYIPGIVRDVFLYIRASSPSSDIPKCGSLTGRDACERDVDAVNYLDFEAIRVLWHQRLGHMHFPKLSELHTQVDGIPKIVLPIYIDGCPSFWVCKIHCTNGGPADTHKDATAVDQGISMGWGFIFQHSKTKGRYDKLSGWNGEMAYLIIADHFSGYPWGLAADRNAPPLAWLNRRFAQYVPTLFKFCYCSLDQGGELANNKEIQAILAYHRYTSWQNAPGERPHLTIGYQLTTMLHGAYLSFKLWHWAFTHYLLLHNMVTHGDRCVPIIGVGGKWPGVAQIRTFGCRVACECRYIFGTYCHLHSSSLSRSAYPKV
jgi:hypothetical protein